MSSDDGSYEEEIAGGSKGGAAGLASKYRSQVRVSKWCRAQSSKTRPYHKGVCVHPGHTWFQLWL